MKEKIKNNKFVKIIVYNLLFLILVLSISELIIFLNAQKTYDKFKKDYNIHSNDLKYTIRTYTYDEEYTRFKKEEMRKVEGRNLNNKAILLFGCSYTYGAGLSRGETISFKLSKLTKRPVYNRGISGGSTQHMYYQLNRDDFYEEIKHEPEYIIYFLVYPYHYSRQFLYTFHLFENKLYLQYEKEGILLKEKKSKLPSFLRGLYTTKYIHYLKNKKELEKGYTEETENLMILMLKNSQKIIKEKFPNSNFIIINFEVNNKDKEKQDKFIEKIKKNGLTIISLKEITGIDYTTQKWRISETDDHPNAEYWNVVVPKLAKALNLY